MKPSLRTRVQGRYAASSVGDEINLYSGLLATPFRLLATQIPLILLISKFLSFLFSKFKVVEFHALLIAFLAHPEHLVAVESMIIFFFLGGSPSCFKLLSVLFGPHWSISIIYSSIPFELWAYLLHHSISIYFKIQFSFFSLSISF
jgi:hypothetical protein